MILHIDTTDSEVTKIGFSDLETISVPREKQSQVVLPAIISLLKKNKKTVKDISQISVNTGPGSFTGLRVGISIANALGYSLGIKVNGKDVVKDGPVEPVY